MSSFWTILCIDEVPEEFSPVAGTMDLSLC